MKGYVRISALVLMLALSIPVARGLRADDEWEEAKRKQARKKAEDAVRKWAASEPFSFRLPDDAYTDERRPKHSGPLHLFYDKHYRRPSVLQLHPYHMDVPNGIEAEIRIPQGVKELSFVVSSHDKPGTDVGWDVKINGKNVLSEKLKTGGRWKVVGVPVREYAGQEVTLRIEARAEGWNYEFLFLDRIGFAGDRLSARSDPIRLVVEQFDSPLARVHVGGTYVGALECLVAQFEREGVGYKKTGTGSAEATCVKSIKIEEGGGDRCLAEVTMVRDLSEETKRRFEAVFRLTLYAGQNWFESRLLSIKNTDQVPYEVRGYGYQLRPGDPDAKPAGFPNCVGSIFGRMFLAASDPTSDSFALAMRSKQAGGYGDITRKLKVKLKPGAAWQADGEPAVVVFVGEGDTGEALFREAHRLRSVVESPKPYGRIVY